jgi:hypothetical protein
MRLPIHLFVLLSLLAVSIGCVGAGMQGTVPGPPLSAFLIDAPQPPSARSAATPYLMPSSLAEDAIASCPVSLPNVSISPNEHYVSTSGSLENADRTLFTDLWTGGKVLATPPFVSVSGSIHMKWPWYRHNVLGQLAVEGRRLDKPAMPLRAQITCCYGDTGFQPSTLIFPTEGC